MTDAAHAPEAPAVLMEDGRPLGPEELPRHVAIIMDGNGRWARRRGLPRVEGHRAGARAVREVVTRARALGIPWLTLYAFSSQNWERPEDEVAHLMTLLVEFCASERELLAEKGIRLRVIGERERLPAAARAAIEDVESCTQDYDAMVLVIAVSYGAREELVHAMRALAEEVVRGERSPQSIQANDIESKLWTAGIPDPDLLIRTSGEVRVSNFLLWQIAYAELYLEDCMWPDFDRAAFDRALRAYVSRERRFGRVDEAGD